MANVVVLYLELWWSEVVRYVWDWHHDLHRPMEKETLEVAGSFETPMHHSFIILLRAISSPVNY